MTRGKQILFLFMAIFTGAIFMSALFTGCNSGTNNKENIGSVIDFAPRHVDHGSEGSVNYVGTWSYSYPLYSRSLFIKKDGTFIFHDRSRFGYGYSEGEWTCKNLRIVLSSYKKYADQSRNSDTVDRYFDNESWTLIGDSLCSIDKNGVLTGFNFALTKQSFQ